MNELISVIIPIYKVEHYLRACLDSVLASTYHNLEIILVDDGSPDNCGDICDEYATLDDRIVVIHQINQGLSAARNAGLAKATGEYIGFVDADDTISPVMYERLLWAMKSTNADMAACEFTRNQGSLNLFTTETENRLYEVVGVNDCLSAIVQAPSSRTYTWTFCVVCNKLYHNKRNIEFRRGISPGEDLLFNYHYLQDTNKMVIVPQYLYFYRDNPTSIMNIRSVKKAVCSTEVWSILADDSSKYESELKKFLLLRAAYESHIASWKIVQSGEERSYDMFLEQARSRVKQHFWQLLFYPDTPWKVRPVLLLYRFCHPLWRIAAKRCHP